MIRVFPATGLEFRQLPGRLAANPLVTDDEVSQLGLAVRVVSLHHQPDRGLHQHPKSAEVSYVVSGDGVVRGADSEERVSTGDFILVPAGTWHATIPDPDSPMVLVCFFPHPNLSDNLIEADA